MKKIYSVQVENRAGVLCKVSGLFSRRCFNIDSLAVGETDDPAISCMTIVSSGNQRTIEQIEKQLNKKLDVIKVKTFDEKDSISRELMLIKVKYNRGTRRDIMEICEIMKADIVDMSNNNMIIQICDMPERIKVMLFIIIVVCKLCISCDVQIPWRIGVVCDLQIPDLVGLAERHIVKRLRMNAAVVRLHSCVCCSMAAFALVGIQIFADRLP